MNIAVSLRLKAIWAPALRKQNCYWTSEQKINELLKQKDELMKKLENLLLKIKQETHKCCLTQNDLKSIVNVLKVMEKQFKKETHHHVEIQLSLKNELCKEHEGFGKDHERAGDERNGT